MAKKRGSTAAKSKANATTTSKKEQATNAQVSLPSLLQNSSSKRPSQDLKVETLVPHHVFYALNFLSKQECNAVIQMVESSGDLEYVAHKATRYIAQRECGRWQQNDVLTASIMFERMKPILSQLKLDCFPPDYIPVACNSNIRLYKYEKGMSFGKHYDGSDSVAEGDTEITVLIYLSECVGGATRFYIPKSKSKSAAFEPNQGAILLHIHGVRCLQHEADAVVSGVKWVLRTDVVYAKQS